MKVVCPCGCSEFEIQQRPLPLNEIMEDIPDSVFPDVPWYAQRDRMVVEVLCKACQKIMHRAYRYGGVR